MARKELIKLESEGLAMRIKNPALIDSVKQYVTGLTNIADGQWTTAEAVHRMLTDKQWEEDFNSERDLIAACGGTQSTWNQMKQAVQFRNDNPQLAGKATISRAYIYASIGNGEEVKAFLTWAKENKIPVNSDKKVKEAKKLWQNKDAIDADYEEKQEPEQEEQEPEQEQAEPKAEQKADMVRFEYDGAFYEIPVKVLAKYKVAE